jgi:hypothetical protein
LPPTGSDEVATVAIPFVTVALPSTVAPLVNDTVPVTLLGRVSVKVTEPFRTDGLTEEVRVPVELALATVCVTVPVAEL